MNVPEHMTAQQVRFALIQSAIIHVIVLLDIKEYSPIVQILMSVLFQLQIIAARMQTVITQ